jgi:hypothetical protein
MTRDGSRLAMNRVKFCATGPQAYGPSSRAPVVSVPRRCLARPATASPTRTTVTAASTVAGERPPPRPAARTSGTPIPGQGRPLRSDPATPTLDRRQGAQGEGHPAAQQPASAGGEGRLATFQDRTFQTDPGCGQPEGERPVPIGIDIVQRGAAVAGALDQGTGRCCPSKVEIGPPQADGGNKSENRHGDRGPLPMRLVDADRDRSDRFAEHQDDQQPQPLWQVLQMNGQAG